jgi:hypothetical protein
MRAGRVTFILELRAEPNVDAIRALRNGTAPVRAAVPLIYGDVSNRARTRRQRARIPIGGNTRETRR